MRHVRRILDNDRRIETRFPRAYVLRAHRLTVQYGDFFQSHRELLVAATVRVNQERCVRRRLRHLEREIGSL